MANGWAPKEVVKHGGVSIGASVTDGEVSKEFGLTAGGAVWALRTEVVVSAFVGVPVLKLQQKRSNGTWSDVKTATAVFGLNVLKMHSEIAADAALMPLSGICRVVATTAGGESVSVSKVMVAQPL